MSGINKNAAAKKKPMKQPMRPKQPAAGNAPGKRPADSMAKSRCPYSKQCGGCDWIDVPYEEQLIRKQETVRKMVGKYGEVAPVIGADNPLHYRCKVHAVFGKGPQGKVISGIYREGTHRIVPVSGCLIEDERADRIIRSIRELAVSFRLPIYDEDTGRGCLRHVLVRTSRAFDQIMVVLVTGSSEFPSRKNFVKALTVLHPEITTVIQNINGKKTSMILGDRQSVLYGKGSIEDELCGLRFRISPGSFFQVDPAQAQTLYETAVRFAHLTGEEKVIDAYCGTGTIGQVCAGRAGEVIGVESNPEAVRDARENAERNNIDNIRFVRADAGEYMMQLASTGERVDTVMMDPPRSGASRQFLKALVTLAPERIVYVSCEPGSLARDLKILTDSGYKVMQIQPVDMFAQTVHVEVVSLLQRMSNTRGKTITLDVEMEDYHRIKGERREV